MNENEPTDLRKRLDDLERKIDSLAETVKALTNKFSVDVKTNEKTFEEISTQLVDTTSEITKQTEQKYTPPPPPPPPGREKVSALAPQPQLERLQESNLPPVNHQQQFEFPEHMKKSEYWLNRIGIALLFFGVAFLFKYSIDEGWLTPWIRVEFGFALGLVILFLGHRIYGKRKTFATTLLGTGIGIWYITGFSAYQLLGLVSHTTAFGFMIFVTASAFFMSLKQNDSILSIIATIGAFGTPFLLYSQGLPDLIIYNSIIIAGGLGIFFFKGWRSVLWITSICGWIIIAAGLNYPFPEFTKDSFSVQMISQAGICFAWLGFWLTPFFRELIHIKKPDKWKSTFVGFADKKLTQATKDILDRHLHVLALTSVLFGLGLSRIVWTNLSDNSWGLIALGLSAIYFAVSYFIRNLPEFKTLKYTHILIAISLFNLAIVLLLDGNILLFSLATQAMFLHLLSERLSDKVISYVAHTLHTVTALWMIGRLGRADFAYHSDGFFDGQTMTDLWVIITFVVAVLKQKSLELKRVYGIAAIATLTAVFLHEFSGTLKMFVISAEALFVFFISRIYSDKLYSIAYHALFGILFYLIGTDYLGSLHDPKYALNLISLTNLWCIFLLYLVFAIEEDINVRRTYILAVILGFAMIIVREFTFNIEYALLSLEAGVVLYLTRASRDKFIQYYSHLYFGFLACWLLPRFINYSLGSSDIVILNWTAFTNLWLIVLIAYISKYISNKEIQITYRIFAHIAFLSYLGFELARLENGQGWVSVSWGIYGISLLLIGLRKNIQRFRIVGLSALAMLVGKLFLIDLEQLEAIWKVLLFIGFGGVFLLLSYYFKSLWKTDKDNTKTKNITE